MSIFIVLGVGFISKIWRTILSNYFYNNYWVFIWHYRKEKKLKPLDSTDLENIYEDFFSNSVNEEAKIDFINKKGKIITDKFLKKMSSIKIAECKNKNEMIYEFLLEFLRFQTYLKWKKIKISKSQKILKNPETGYFLWFKNGYLNRKDFKKL